MDPPGDGPAPMEEDEDVELALALALSLQVGDVSTLAPRWCGGVAPHNQPCLAAAATECLCDDGIVCYASVWCALAGFLARDDRLHGLRLLAAQHAAAESDQNPTSLPPARSTASTEAA